ncbi:MAG: trigger factor [Lachnospiraceae bacterium]|nr:trigger factor [Lachnospiraceae bacterium]
MKKKFVLMCMTGMMVFGMCACGDKKADQEPLGTETEAETTSTALGEENADGESSTEAERVSDRPGYVGFQDLEIEEYITLADYKNMKVSAVKPAADDAAIESYINSALLVGNITNRAVKEGDVADIDFVGKKDGEAFQGGSGSGYKLGIGTGSFIPGFEDGLVGVMPGETVDLNLTFPENYTPNPDLAGQDVVFTVTVNSIQGSAEYATVTEEEMKDMGLAYQTKEEVWEAGKKAVEENAEETFTANSRNAIVQKLVEESEVQSVPDYLVEEEAQNYNNYMKSLSQSMYGMEFEDFVAGAYGMTMEQYNEQLNEMCTDVVKQYMVMEAVARAEGIEITDELIQEKADGEAAEYGYASGDELIDEVGYATYRMSIVQEKAIERLMEIIDIEEENAQAAE